MLEGYFPCSHSRRIESRWDRDNVNITVRSCLLILSDYAEESGFCEKIWTLPRGRAMLANKWGALGEESKENVYTGGCVDKANWVCDDITHPVDGIT